MTNKFNIQNIEPNILKDIYTMMFRIQECDQRIQRWLTAGKLQFQYYPCGGQEAIPSAFTALLNDDDYMITTYRCIHDVLAKGSSVKDVFSEIAGKKEGLCQGKGGPMHLSDPEKGLMVTSGIVGGGVPIANGFGLSSILNKTGKITLVSFGDGAANIGAVHEAMNLAALWQLPVIFLCQNNQYAEYTAYSDSTKSKNLTKRADSYEMHSINVDGRNPVSLYYAAKEAIDRARDNKGPTFVEAVCDRLQGHAFGSEEEHMDQEKLSYAKNNSPIKKFREQLISENILSIDEIEQIEADATNEVDNAEEYTEKCLPPTESDLYDDVFSDNRDIPDLDSSVHSLEPRIINEENSENITYCQSITNTLDYALGTDESIVIMGEDIADPAGGVVKATYGLSTKYGLERVRPTPISEQAIVGAAIGASMAGLRPVAEIMVNDFLGVCMDQVTNHAAKLRYMSGGKTNVPITIRTMIAGNVGSFGAQHSQSLESWLTHSPGIKVVAPGTPSDLKGLLLSCIYDDDPCVVMESMGLYFGSGQVPIGDYRIPLGLADIKREGSDITIITYGASLLNALEVASELENDGISVEVLDLRSLVPLDKNSILNSVRKTKRAVVLHGAVKFCGFGAEISSFIHENLFTDLKKPVARIGSAYTPIPFSKDLENYHFPNNENIKATIKNLM
ncbi:MAG: dehydrogenase [Methanobacteriota archaeon]|jgi:2-oxoisovalerate dehydrogenase E1 component|nr:MAG: dehydrogenase [Euryarchaeota archaeon]